jgi:hypothetical protein
MSSTAGSQSRAGSGGTAGAQMAGAAPGGGSDRNDGGEPSGGGATNVGGSGGASSSGASPGGGANSGGSSGSGGSSTSGGSSANGGSSISGASSGGSGSSVCAPDCAKKTIASTGLIDDFEMSIAQKLAGGWFSYNDGTGTTTPAASGSVMPVLATGVDGETFAMHLNGAAHTSWGGGLGAWFDGCVDISAFTKLTFNAKGAGAFHFSVTTFETNACSEGGGCASGCRVNFKEFALTAAWAAFEIDLSELTGGSAAFSKQKVQSVSFAVKPPVTTPYAFELWLDDVTFQ